MLKITKHNGTSYPGYVAYKLCWDFLRCIQKPDTLIAVTGTNGKTTVARMIADCLRADGKSVMINDRGSNILWGILSVFIDNISITGKCRTDAAVIEVDESSAKAVIAKLPPDLLIVTNLSTDTVMRSAHPGHTAKLLDEAVRPGTRLILNGDDLFVSGIAKDNERVTFGLGEMEGDRNPYPYLLNDAKICPECAGLLTYDYVKYHHIGKAHCPACGFRSPDNDYHIIAAGAERKTAPEREADPECKTASEREAASERKTVSMDCKGRRCVFGIRNDSIYNLYNYAAVIACLSELGYEADRIDKLLESVRISEDRFDVVNAGEYRIILQMAKGKNPISTSQPLMYVRSGDYDKEVILMQTFVEDVKYWAENLCWIYDTDFELLRDEHIKKTIVNCAKGKDYYLRLLLAGIDRDRLQLAAGDDEAADAVELDRVKEIHILYSIDLVKNAVYIADRLRERIERMQRGNRNTISGNM